VDELGESEVGDDAFEAVFFPDENVLGFEIAVHDSFVMHLF
jgi:hypothetical protein